MKFNIFRRPYNIGFGWRQWQRVEAENCTAALMMQEFGEETMLVDTRDDRIGILGGASEFVALTDEEIEGWDLNKKLPAKQ